MPTLGMNVCGLEAERRVAAPMRFEGEASGFSVNVGEP